MSYKNNKKDIMIFAISSLITISLFISSFVLLNYNIN